MNLLEHYIEEVHKEEDIGDGYLKVTVTCNCYGDVREYTHFVKKSQWEREKQMGYFLA